MALRDVRAGVRILLAGGTFGVCAEVVWLRFGILSGFAGPEIWDLTLAEIAVTVVIYGMIFGIAIIAIRYPAWAFPSPTRSPDTPLRRWMRDHPATFRIIPFVLVPLVYFMEQLYLFAIGLFTPKYAVSTTLHLYPILLCWGAVFAFNREIWALRHTPARSD